MKNIGMASEKLYGNTLISEWCRIFTDWVANQSARKTLSTVLVHTKHDYPVKRVFQSLTTFVDVLNLSAYEWRKID